MFNRGITKELSIFADESGGQNGISKYCLMALVLHDQDEQLDAAIERYKSSMNSREFSEIPFYASPLIYGKGDYSGLDFTTRKGMFSAFFVFVRNLPVSYKTFAYRRSEASDTSAFIARLKRDIVVFLVDNLGYFQSFGKIKIYYDNGQHMITKVLHGALDFALSKEATMYRNASPVDYYLFQATDFICTMELTAIKHETKEETNSDRKIFGSVTTFKKNYLKQLRRKRLA